MTYKVVTLPIEFDGELNVAAKLYEDTINQYAAEGYKLIAVKSINSATKSGCFKDQTTHHHATLLIFGRD